MADKGYTFVKKRPNGPQLMTPQRAKRGEDCKTQTLNSENANFSRRVTAVRNVVEHIIGL